LSFVKRNRIVSVRITQDEYQTLDRISRGHGANSVSEFLRQLIMDSEPFASAAKVGTREFTEELDKLKRKVDRLSQIVKQGVKKQKVQDALSDKVGTQADVLQDEPVADS
jgi:predicted CopG family antitoxin